MVLQPEEHAIFCYGDTIYNPSGRDITTDVEFHESIHTRQQGTDPDAWWSAYLTDPDFRLSQEIEAYGEQYQYGKKRIEALDDLLRKEGKKMEVGKTKLLRWSLESMATALAGQSYGNLLSFNQALSKIRNYSQ